MNILVTGGAGFIGSHLTDALLSAGHRVTVLDNLSSGAKEHLSEDAEFVHDDMRTARLDTLFQTHHFDTVYHEAAQTLVPVSIEDPHYDADQNIMGLLSILEASRKHGVRKVIFSSSAAVYGDNPTLPLTEKERPDPTSFYGLTKWMTERYLALYHKLYGLDYTVLRYSNVYGPRQGAKGEGGVIYIFAKALAEGKALTIFGDGGQTRDFISVHDVVSANMAALTRGEGGTFNISTSTETSMNALAAQMAAYSGSTLPVHHAPPRAGDIYRSCLDNSDARHHLAWRPKIQLPEGLKETLHYFQEHL